MCPKSSIEKSLGRVFILLFVMFPLALTQPLRCVDDVDWSFGPNFGRYQAKDGQFITRNCAWITEDPVLAEPRRDEWCNTEWNPYNPKLVKDKCPEACRKKECNPPAALCIDRTPGGKIWYDRQHYNCQWYASYRENCNIFGGDFRNFGFTAKEACCACGGGLPGPRGGFLKGSNDEQASSSNN